MLISECYIGMWQGEIHHVINPDPFRGVFGSDATRYAKDVQDHIEYGTSGKVAGFIAETIQVKLATIVSFRCFWFFFPLAL